MRVESANAMYYLFLNRSYAELAVLQHFDRVRPRHNVVSSSIQRRIGRFSPRTEPSVRWCGPVSAG